MCKHYLGKWLHNIISPKAKLSNYLYRDGDCGAYIAAEYLIGAIDFFLHCDGAKMYKSFEKGGKYEGMGIIRVGCVFWGSHTSAERLSVILTIVRSALMNCLNVYQYIVYCLKTIHCYKGDLADLLANKWKPSEAALVPILA